MVSQRRFLVDTGASNSKFPHWSSSPPTGPLLAGPSGTAIPCWGEKEFELSFDNKKFKWLLLLGEVKFPILGIFLPTPPPAGRPGSKLLGVRGEHHRVRSPQQHAATTSTHCLCS